MQSWYRPYRTRLTPKHTSSLLHRLGVFDAFLTHCANEPGVDVFNDDSFEMRYYGDRDIFPTAGSLMAHVLQDYKAPSDDAQRQLAAYAADAQALEADFDYTQQID